MGEVDVQVPRGRIHQEGREIEFRSDFLPRNKRLTRNAEALIVMCYLCGISTRRCKIALAQALGAGVSKSQVSRCLESLKPEWAAWQERDLSKDHVVRLILDGFVVSARMGSKSYKVSVLVAMGILADGRKVVLSIKGMGGESKAGWREVLDDLSSRGVSSPQVCMIDGSKGLRAAISEVWPETLVQRCTVHKERNLLACAPDALHEEIKADYTKMIASEDMEEASALRTEFLSKWRVKCPKVAASLEEAGEELFTYLRFPAAQHKSLRTTNAIERLNEEFRRRVKVQGTQPSAESVCMLLWALLASGAVQMHRVQGFETLSEQPKEIKLAA
jgi:transposase-like protein